MKRSPEQVIADLDAIASFRHTEGAQVLLRLIGEWLEEARVNLERASYCEQVNGAVTEQPNHWKISHYVGQATTYRDLITYIEGAEAAGQRLIEELQKARASDPVREDYMKGLERPLPVEPK